MNNTAILKQQLIRYIIIGAGATIINYTIFFSLTKFASVNYLLAHTIAFITSVLVGYTFNKNWTYQSSSESKKDVVKYYLVYLFSLTLGLILLKFLVSVAHLDSAIAKILEIGVTASTNFLGIKVLVFEDKKFMKKLYVKSQHLKFFTIGFILLISSIPLLFNLPFRDNLFLTWEGTYRLSIGQIPYKDFTMPIGYGFFIIPLFFFKLFGPVLLSLLYAQVFINIILLFVLGQILRLLKVSEMAIFFGTLVFGLSYTFIFFWPWYNHTAFFFEMVGLLFVLKMIFSEDFKINGLLWSIPAGLFIFLSLFTKQDYGGLAFVFASFLLVLDAITSKRWKPLLAFFISYIVFAIIFIGPLLSYDFGYWFNHGQPPHSSRLSLFDFIAEFFAGSWSEKVYLLMITLLVFYRFKSIKDFLQNKNHLYLFLLTLGMIVQTLLTKVTSRLPSETTTYFHAFVVAYLFSEIGFVEKLRNPIRFFTALGLVIVWWSSVYWDYANRIIKPIKKSEIQIVKTEINTKKNLVWKTSNYKSFKKITLPNATISGMDSVKILYDLLESKKPIVLNMSELTPLAVELGYEPIRNLPLWYHLNVGIFRSQVDTISSNIRNQTYDLVLFEFVPGLDNFYPFELRDSLKKYYANPLVFPAPRKDGKSIIEVFIKKS